MRDRLRWAASVDPLGFDYSGHLERSVRAFEAAADEAAGRPKIWITANAQTFVWMAESARVLAARFGDAEVRRLLDLSTLRSPAELPTRCRALDGLRDGLARLVERLRADSAQTIDRLGGESPAARRNPSTIRREPAPRAHARACASDLRAYSYRPDPGWPSSIRDVSGAPFR